MSTLLSLNIGKPELVPGKATPTGINKRPVVEAVVGPEGFDGDAVLDRKHHGGVDQAVYLYLQSDYDWWADELGEALPPGTFGENFTIAGLHGDTLKVGDRLASGDLLFEITSHREPCATLAARMGDPKWVRRFHKAHRPGAYLRVLQGGVVRPGIEFTYTPYLGETVTMTELVDIEGKRIIDPDFMRRALKAPIHWKMRRDFEQKLGLATP